MDAATPAQTATRIARQIATEIGAAPAQVTAAAELLDGGATVPFIARYRKEVTGGLDDTQLRTLAERLVYLREMEARRAAILESIREQGKLTDELARADRRRRDQGRARGHLPALQAQAPHQGDDRARERAGAAGSTPSWPTARPIPAALAAAYVAKDVVGRQGRAGRRARHPGRGIVRERGPAGPACATIMRREAVIASSVVEGKEEAGAKFSDYFDHREPWAKIAGHRALAMLRGRQGRGR